MQKKILAVCLSFMIVLSFSAGFAERIREWAQGKICFSETVPYAIEGIGSNTCVVCCNLAEDSVSSCIIADTSKLIDDYSQFGKPALVIFGNDGQMIAQLTDDGTADFESGFGTNYDFDIRSLEQHNLHSILGIQGAEDGNYYLYCLRYDTGKAGNLVLKLTRERIDRFSHLSGRLTMTEIPAKRWDDIWDYDISAGGKLAMLTGDCITAYDGDKIYQLPIVTGYVSELQWLDDSTLLFFARVTNDATDNQYGLFRLYRWDITDKTASEYIAPTDNTVDVVNGYDYIRDFDVDATGSVVVIFPGWEYSDGLMAGEITLLNLKTGDSYTYDYSEKLTLQLKTYSNQYLRLGDSIHVAPISVDSRVFWIK